MTNNNHAPDLSFHVDGAEVVPHAATPLIALKLRIDATSGVPIHSVLLRCQIHIEATRRRYNAEAQAKLFDLFGQPEEWGRTLRGMLWANSNITVQGFTGSTVVDLPVPCTYDFNVAAVKYFDALDDGEVPLSLLFNGTIFYATDQNNLQVGQIPWDKEAEFRFPVRVWREMMDHYHPNTAWLHLQKDVFDRLSEYKRRQALPTWEQTIESLLPPVHQPAN